MQTLFKSSAEAGKLEVICPNPDKNLYNFNAKVNLAIGIEEEEKTYDLELKQFLHSVSSS